MARILVIDDDDYGRAAVHDVLSELGHVVVIAHNGREGVARYREHQSDLVITDIIMPERNGLDVIRELAPSGVRIITMSGGGRLGHENPLADALRLGASRALEKPFTIDAMIAAVNGVLVSAPKVLRPTPAA
jgi:CheY-like chemotaxis protein